MALDAFRSTVDTPTAPALTCFPITPNDTNELAQITKAIYMGTGGDITLRPARGENDVLFRNVPGGSILDVRVLAIKATGTTAADIVGLV